MGDFKTFLNEAVDASQEHDILSMYQDRHRYQVRQISALTGVSIAGIYRTLEKYGLRPRRRDSSGQHDVIRQYHQAGVPARRISDLTGYSRRQVYNIISGRR